MSVASLTDARDRRSEEYGATLDHIERIARKRATLEHAQADAEEQLLAAVARVADTLTLRELAALYQHYRDIALPGFMGRWAAAVPGWKPQQLLRVARGDQAAIDTAVVEWAGEWPFVMDQRTPPQTVPVVYVLFGPDLQPCYVGSTSWFRQRLRRHAADGKVFAHWRAHRCRDRDEAYRLEADWLDRYMPPLNRRREGRR